ncbi:MAG TPA: polysaccharide deacetylase family protein [Bacillota bacterium]|nr:polysaccharide deacetylase family protein [Bacillota bacterium]
MIFKVIFEKYWKLLIAIILIIAVGYLLFWLRRYSAPQIFGEAVLKVKTDQKVMALTFDDGPNPQSTEKILILLKKYQSKATFFVVGNHAKKYPDLIRKIYNHGNEVGNHSWDHERLIYKNPALVRKEIDLTDELLRKLGYQGSIYFRAPYGHKLFVLPYILMKTHRKHILWTLELNDWDSPPPEKMLERFEREARPGAIVLLHDGYDGKYQSREATVKVVELILKKYREKGYHFVTISELLAYGG